MDGSSVKKWLVVASLFLIIPVQSAAECDKYQRAGKTLSFVRCQQVLFANLCNHDDHFGVSCVGFKNSYRFLQALITKCGSFYNECYSVEEQKEILKMWTRQFIRDLVRSPEKFDDRGVMIKIGTYLENTVHTFMDELEIVQIKSFLVNKGYNKEYTKKNLTSKINIIHNKDGSERQITKGYSTHHWSLPSFWSWCQWKLNRYSAGKFIEYMPNLFRCDGKCNNNTGDNQLWWSNSVGYTNWDPVNKESIGETHFGGYLEEEPLKSIFYKELNVEMSLESADFTDFDQARMTMCRGFKTLIDNLTEPVDRCIGQVQVKEVVWGELLHMINRHINFAIGVAIRVTGNKKILGDFTYRDCKMFGLGGTVAGGPAKCVGNLFLMLASLISIMIFRMEV